MSRVHPIPVAYQVWFSDTVVCSVVSPAAKPVYRRAIIHSSNISILVVLKALGNLTASIKGLTVV